MLIYVVAFSNFSLRASDEGKYIDPCGRAYDDSEYLDPCDLYNDCIYEYQQVQNVYDSDGHEEEVLSGDDTSVSDSSGSLPESVCGGDLSDLSDEAMDTLNNEGVDGCEEVSARHALTVTSHAQNVGYEMLESEEKSSDNNELC